MTTHMFRMLRGFSGAVAVLAVLPSVAAAAATPIASTNANVPLSAASGWVVWSQHAATGWKLVGWHGGAVVTIPAAPRARPFDLDVGTDPRGRAVATFSRCKRTPAVDAYGHPRPWTGSGCRIRILDLSTGRERSAAVPTTNWSSDTTPSMWRGSIAFARRDTRHAGSNSQIELWDAAAGRLSTLKPGGIPNGCPFGPGGCTGLPVRGAVQGLDLGTRLVTFLWWVEAPRVVGHGGWEVIADTRDARTSTLAGAGANGEACAGGIDRTSPSTPTAAGQRVWFLELASTCYQYTSSVIRYSVAPLGGSVAPIPGVALQFTKDGNSIYTLVADQPTTQDPPTCAAPSTPCRIEHSTVPKLGTLFRRPSPPFF